MTDSKELTPLEALEAAFRPLAQQLTTEDESALTFAIYDDSTSSK